MTTNTERSYGVIVYRESSRGIELCMVHQVSGDHWSFPKGHHEAGESIEETVLRELEEETGIQEIEIIPEAHFVERYQFERQGAMVEKCIEYRLGKLAGAAPDNFHTDEIIEVRWGTMEDLAQLPLYPQKHVLLGEIAQWYKTHTMTA